MAIIGIILGILSVWGIIIVIPLAAMLIYGLKKERSGFMLPYLVFMVTIHVLCEGKNATEYLFIDH